ncbi:ATPase [Brevibacillus sp. VP]|uniref:AAA family ATPase n=1 Tax=Brevibacillus sp. VP TaxID=2293326 RepID=UPI000E2F821E|nr:AAA family ATPase [Brevibacillus sp. VP]RFB31991.1 ATPase [Brevibacillus sp. VP]
MEIKFISIKLHNFKSHRDLVVEFGDLTKITGDNARGKSSILESISWTLYGTDTLGSKTDPTPTNYKYDHISTELLLSVDNKQILLARSIEKEKNKLYVNEVPTKSTEFDELVKSLFDKELFLALFNPFYFPSLHWEKQRSMLLQYVTPPLNKEVFAELPETQAKKLSDQLKKHTLSDLEKIHRDNKNKMDKSLIAEASSIRTLQKQLKHVSQLDINAEDTKTEIERLTDQIKEIEATTFSASENNQRYNSLNARIQSLQEQISDSASKWPTLRDEAIANTCRTCKRLLDTDSIEAVKTDKVKREEQYKAKHKSLVTKRNELQSQLAQLVFIDVSEQIEKIRELEKKQKSLLANIAAQDQREQLLDQIKQAESAEAETHESRSDSILVLDAIKAFEAKAAELQAVKVQELFTTLSVRLFKQNKGDGEYKPDFEIEMDGKSYRKLSLSETILAGLELRDVLSRQSGIVAPCFVDNAESITRFTRPLGQLITSRVIADQELIIETGDN